MKTLDFNSSRSEDKAFIVALVMVAERVRSFPDDDRRDLDELAKEFLTAFAIGDTERYESAVCAMMEIFNQVPARTAPMDVSEDMGGLKKWADYIGNRLRQLRGEAGLTQDELAERSGIAQSYICRLEKGQHSPNALTLEKLAKGLGVPVGQLDPNAPEFGSEENEQA